MTTLREDLMAAVEALENEASAGWEHRPRRTVEALSRLRARLEQMQQYDPQNPLGGPAKVFYAMGDAIRAGDDYHATLGRYGYAEALAKTGDEPVAWAVTPRYEDEQGFFDYTDSKETAEKLVARGWTITPLYTSPLNLSDKSVQKRLATQWGYVEAQPITVASLALAAGTKMLPIIQAFSAVGIMVTVNQPLTQDLIGTALSAPKAAAPAVDASPIWDILEEAKKQYPFAFKPPLRMGRKD